MKVRNYYLLTIRWEEIDGTLSVAFNSPPLREDVYQFLRRHFLRLNESVQDDAWEFLLIADLVPKIPWLGKLENVYGSVECHQRFMIVNGQDEGVLNADDVYADRGRG